MSKTLPEFTFFKKLVALLTALFIAMGPTAAPLLAANPAASPTPIQHLVIVFQENVSFDHYFGTIPMPPIPPANRAGIPSFVGTITGPVSTLDPTFLVEQG